MEEGRNRTYVISLLVGHYSIQKSSDSSLCGRTVKLCIAVFDYMIPSFIRMLPKEASLIFELFHSYDKDIIFIGNKKLDKTYICD